MIINPAQQVYGKEEINSAIEVIKSGHWAEGIYAEKFRDALKKYIGIKYCSLTNSGSSANLVAVMSLTTHWIPENRRLKEGDEIITTALCFPTTLSPIYYARCVPVFVDVEKSTWNINISEVKKAITSKTKAIIASHNLGNPCNLIELRKICDDNKLWLIEDNCDSLSSEIEDKKTGSIGDISTCSFYPAHHISCGEGGAVLTNNILINKAINSMINWGRDCWCNPNQDNACKARYNQKHGDLPFGYDHKNTYAELGFNLKMTDIQASIGIEQLKRIDIFKYDRRRNHQFLTNLFIKWNEWFDLNMEIGTVSWFGYVIKINKKAPFKSLEMIKYLDDNGIRSRAFFCGNITKQPCLFNRNVKFRSLDLKVTDDIMNNAFWIGVHPAIKVDERNHMRTIITNFLNQYV